MSYYCGLFYIIDILLRRIQGEFFIVPLFVKRFLWDLFVFTKYSYYCDFFCFGTALRLCDRHSHG